MVNWVQEALSMLRYMTEKPAWCHKYTLTVLKKPRLKKHWKPSKNSRWGHNEKALCDETLKPNNLSLILRVRGEKNQLHKIVLQPPLRVQLHPPPAPYSTSFRISLHSSMLISYYQQSLLCWPWRVELVLTNALLFNTLSRKRWEDEDKYQPILSSQLPRSFINLA